MEKLIGFVFGAMIAIPVFFTMSLYAGWALSVGWGWVMVPLFGAPTLTVSHGTAVMALWGLFRYQDTSKSETDTPKVVLAFFSPIICLAVVWVAIQFWPAAA